ncbi:hypothetical protein MHBO_002783 [Bonamia ostreae]|uniref:Uncharacterized protein n=1 Tax=Bonamia ostreae TaxID=126728 RepID=A0ABV2ANH8_9EUKA
MRIGMFIKDVTSTSISLVKEFPTGFTTLKFTVSLLPNMRKPVENKNFFEDKVTFMNPMIFSTGHMMEGGLGPSLRQVIKIPWSCQRRNVSRTVRTDFGGVVAFKRKTERIMKGTNHLKSSSDRGNY